jgi:hypothetical protein
MTTGRFRHIRLVILLGTSLFLPLFLANSVYVDLSGTGLFSYDMSFEYADDEDLSTCQNELRVFVPQVSSDPLLIATQFCALSYPFSSPITSHTQNSPVLRC